MSEVSVKEIDRLAVLDKEREAEKAKAKATIQANQPAKASTAN